jgi:hypothetical protein
MEIPVSCSLIYSLLFNPVRLKTGATTTNADSTGRGPQAQMADGKGGVSGAGGKPHQVRHLTKKAHSTQPYPGRNKLRATGSSTGTLDG